MYRNCTGRYLSKPIESTQCKCVCRVCVCVHTSFWSPCTCILSEMEGHYLPTQLTPLFCNSSGSGGTLQLFTTCPMSDFRSYSELILNSFSWLQNLLEERHEKQMYISKIRRRILPHIKSPSIIWWWLMNSSNAFLLLPVWVSLQPRSNPHIQSHLPLSPDPHRGTYMCAHTLPIGGLSSSLKLCDWC